MYTCDNRYRPRLLYWNSTDKEVEDARIDSLKHTYFIVHGFRDYYAEDDWMGVSNGWVGYDHGSWIVIMNRDHGS